MSRLTRCMCSPCGWRCYSRNRRSRCSTSGEAAAADGRRARPRPALSRLVLKHSTPIESPSILRLPRRLLVTLIEAGCGAAERKRMGASAVVCHETVLARVCAGCSPFACSPNSVRSLRERQVENRKPGGTACAASCCASIRHDDRSSALSWIAILLLIRFAIFQAALGLQFSELGAVKRVVE